MRKYALVAALLSAALFQSCASGNRGVAPGSRDGTAQREGIGRRIDSLLDGGGFAAALTLADSLLARGEADSRTLGRKARALGGLGRSAEAVALFEEALLKDYGSCENHLHFATYLMKLGKTGRALTEFSEAKRYCSDANTPVIFRNLAVSSIKLGKLDEARRYVDDGLRADPADAYLVGLKAMLIAREHPAEAENLFIESQRLGAASPEFLVQYGLLLVNAGRPREAVEVFEKVVAEAPGDREARAFLAEALDRSGGYDRAEEILRKLLAERDEAEVRARLARVLFHRGAYGESLEIYRGLEPTPEVMDRVAMCLHNLGRTDEAIPWERKALAAKPDWPQAMINLSVMLGAKGKLDEAETLLKRVLVIEPESATAREDLKRLREARRRE